MAKSKPKRWMKFRHRVARNLIYAVIKPYSRIKYGIKVEKFKDQEKRPYLVLYNHQTAFDQFFVGIAFSGPVYYLASEDLFSKGWVSSLIRYLVAPIPIKKQTADVKAVINCMRVAKEGGTLAIAPEGNRTYSGKTGYMSPTIAPLARKLGMPIALFRIEGGYGVHPRWSDVVRGGSMRAYVSRVISPEEYSSLSDAELMAMIEEGLYVNEAKADGEYKHGRLAEYLERAIYTCPKCGLSELESHGDIIECKRCAGKVRYTKTKELVGEGFDFPFRFVSEWYDYQIDLVNSLDPREHTATALYIDTVSVSEVVPYKNKQPLLKSANLELYGDRVIARTADTELSFEFDKTSAVVVLGRNKLNIYKNGKIYQFKGTKRFCALKYVNIFHRYKNITKGDQNGKFLGL